MRRERHKLKKGKRREGKGKVIQCFCNKGKGCYEKYVRGLSRKKTRKPNQFKVLPKSRDRLTRTYLPNYISLLNDIRFRPVRPSASRVTRPYMRRIVNCYASVLLTANNVLVLVENVA